MGKGGEGKKPLIAISSFCIVVCEVTYVCPKVPFFGFCLVNSEGLSPKVGNGMWLMLLSRVATPTSNALDTFASFYFIMTF